jgi:hypothetical protein
VGKQSHKKRVQQYGINESLTYYHFNCITGLIIVNGFAQNKSMNEMWGESAVSIDAKAIARLVKDAGMKYIIITSTQPPESTATIRWVFRKLINHINIL